MLGEMNVKSTSGERQVTGHRRVHMLWTSDSYRGSNRYTETICVFTTRSPEGARMRLIIFQFSEQYSGNWAQ